MKPLPRRATLQEAADAMTERTRDAWTARDILGAAARGEVTIHAKLPHGMRMVRCEPIKEGPNEWACPAGILFPLDADSALRLLTGPRIEVRELWGMMRQELPGHLGVQYAAGPEFEIAEGETAPTASIEDCSIEDSALLRLVEMHAPTGEAESAPATDDAQEPSEQRRDADEKKVPDTKPSVSCSPGWQIIESEKPDALATMIYNALHAIRREGRPTPRAATVVEHLVASKAPDFIRSINGGIEWWSTIGNREHTKNADIQRRINRMTGKAAKK